MDNAALTIAMELNIRNQMKYLTSMFNVQALTRDEYIATDVFGYIEKGGDK